MNNRLFKNISLFILVTPLLSCSSTNKSTIELNQYSSMVLEEGKDKTYANYTTSLTSAELQQKIENQNDFVSIIYSTSCHFCSEIEPYILNYVLDNQYQFYSINIYEPTNEIANLNSIFSVLYNVSTYDVQTPSVVIFKEGTILYEKIGFASKERNQKFITNMFNYYITTGQYIND